MLDVDARTFFFFVRPKRFPSRPCLVAFRESMVDVVHLAHDVVPKSRGKHF